MADYITVVAVDNGVQQPINATANETASTTQRPLHASSETLSCDQQHGTPIDSQFITVLSINDHNHKTDDSSRNVSTIETSHHSMVLPAPCALAPAEPEPVTVYRLPGERLGFGLKFQGGTHSTECIQKLFIQSCAADSPASRAQTSWGHLREGDEIVEIDGTAVLRLTRLECVRCLKESQLAIRLTVRNGDGQQVYGSPTGRGDTLARDSTSGQAENSAETRKLSGLPPKPPPVPPRKINRRKSAGSAIKPNIASVTAVGGSGSEGHALLKQVVGSLAAGEKPFTPPPDAEFYINLFSGMRYVRVFMFSYL